MNGINGSWTNSDDFDVRRFEEIYRPVLRRQQAAQLDDDSVTHVPTYASMSESDLLMLDDISSRLDAVERQLNSYEGAMERFWAELDALYPVLDQVHESPPPKKNLWWLAVCVPFVLVVLFVIRSQLNGNNGSCTNLDDMLREEGAHFHHRERRRAQREAANRRIHGRTVGARRGNGQFQDVLRGFVGAAAPPTPGAQGPELPDGHVHQWGPGPWVFENPVPGPYYVNGCYTMEPPMEDNRPRILYIDDPLPWVHRTHTGYAVIKYQPRDEEPVNTTPAIRSPCCIQVTIPAYRRRNVIGSDEEKIGYEEQSFVILTPLLAALRKFLPSSRLDEGVKSSAINYMMKILPNEFVEPYGIDTVRYFHAKIHRDQTVAFGDPECATKLANNGQAIGYADSGRTNNIAALMTKTDVFMPIEVPNVEAVLPRYQLRDDFHIRRCSRLREASGRADSIFFDLAEPQPRCSTQFCGLHGLNQSTFQEYSNSPNNMNHAAKRILGAKENEPELRLQAGALGLRMLKTFARRGPGSVNAIRSGGEYNVSPFHVPTGNHHEVCWRALNGIRGERVRPRFEIGDLEAAEQPVHKFVAVEAARLSHRVNRTTLTKIVDGSKNALSWVYYSMYKQILESWYPLIPRHAAAKIPHVKRKLRQAYVNSRRLHVDDDVCIKRLDACIKRELAKWGKAPRLFISYGEGCMYANELPEYVKMCLDGLHVVSHKGFTCVIWIMAKPKSDSLEKIFYMLKEALCIPDHMFVAIYSDDAVYSGTQVVDGSRESFGANVDVSSNDSSQDVPAFFMLYSQLANFHKERAYGLIEQCLKPIRFTNPVDREDWFEVEFDGPFEGSGTTLTTTLNHNGSFLIAVATAYFIGEGISFVDALHMGATAIGHTITVERWDEDGNFVFERAQFLKRSPFPSPDGKSMSPGINIATILRRFGLVENDLTHEKLGVSPIQFEAMSFPERFERYASGIMLGWKHEPSHPILDALRKRFSRTDAVEVVPDSVEHIFKEPRDIRQVLECSQIVTGGSGEINIRERYGLTVAEEEEIVVAISEIQVGQVISTTGLAKIYHVDYGVPMEHPQMVPGYEEPQVDEEGFIL